MLQIPQLQGIRLDDAQYYEAFVAIQNAVNNISLKTGVDGSPSSQNAQPGVTQANFPPPAPPASMAVTAQVTGASKIYGVGIAMSPDDDGISIQYFVEWSTAPNFATANVLRLGLQNFLAAILLPNATAYWRARCKFPESVFSSYTYFGTAATPTGV